MNEDTIDVIILGRKLGTASGWDTVDELVIVFYDFVSDRPEIAAASALQADFNTGILATVTDNGQHSWETDMVNLLVNFT